MSETQSTDARREALRALPSVSQFLESADGSALCDRFGEGLIKHLLRRELESQRKRIQTSDAPAPACTDRLTATIETQARRLLDPQTRRAVNATGILLHTGLGRAPMSDKAIAALGEAGRYTPVQIDLETAARSKRDAAVEQMLIELTGCEAATVVNNNAAATMLILNTLARGREVVISRGQLIEIGGAFRMPDVMDRSGATMREVGTTNRTHLRDYEAAIGEATGALIHVHTSNFRVRGFQGTPNTASLVTLGKQHNIPVVDDLGSGALVPLSEWGLADEPLVKDSIRAGADVVCFSGDKLICGPQSGIICGKKEIIEKIRKNPYARMFRICKLTLAALEVALSHFLNDDFRSEVPFYRMMSMQSAQLNESAQRIADALGAIENCSAVCVDDLSYVGSGSLPDQGLSTRSVRLRVPGKADDFARALRQHLPPVFCRVQDDAVCLDPRTLLPGDHEKLLAACREIAKESA